MRILTTRRFERDFRKLPREVKRRLDEAIRVLAENPYVGKRLRVSYLGGGASGSVITVSSTRWMKKGRPWFF